MVAPFITVKNSASDDSTASSASNFSAPASNELPSSSTAAYDDPRHDEPGRDGSRHGRPGHNEPGGGDTRRGDAGRGAPERTAAAREDAVTGTDHNRYAHTERERTSLTIALLTRRVSCCVWDRCCCPAVRVHFASNTAWLVWRRQSALSSTTRR